MVSDIFRHWNERLNTFQATSDLVDNVDIETIEDLKAALKEVGYSNNAINEIIKWYTATRTLLN
jgi:predicted Ser/Thr protein kinase